MGVKDAETDWSSFDRKERMGLLPKDVILKLAGILTVKGGTNAIIEYFGEGQLHFSGNR